MEHQPQGPPPYQPLPPTRGRIVWRALFPALLHIGLQVFAMVAVMIAVMMPSILRAAADGGYFPDDDYLTLLTPQITMYSLAFSASFSVILFYFLYRHYRRLFPLTPFYSPSVLPLTAVIALAGNFAVLALVTAAQEIWDTALPTSSLDGIIENVPLPLLLFTVCIAVPVAEELCFRGLMLNHLRCAFRFWTANIIQAAVFGLIHGVPIQIAYAFLFGLLLGWIVRRTGRLKTAVIAHIVFNSAFIPLGMIPGIESLMENPAGLTLYLFLPSIAVTLIAIRLFDSATSKKQDQM